MSQMRGCWRAGFSVVPAVFLVLYNVDKSILLCSKPVVCLYPPFLQNLILTFLLRHKDEVPSFALREFVQAIREHLQDFRHPQSAWMNVLLSYLSHGPVAEEMCHHHQTAAIPDGHLANNSANNRRDTVWMNQPYQFRSPQTSRIKTDLIEKLKERSQDQQRLTGRLPKQTRESM